MQREEKHRILKLLLMTLILAWVILFILQTSQDTRWGGGYWDQLFAKSFGLTPAAAHQVVFWTRKTIHFTGYGALALFLLAYFRLARFKTPILWGILSAFLIAGLDEYMQSRASFRTGQPSDVLLDLAGILFFCILTKIMVKS